MSTSSIVFGLVITFLLFLVVHFYKAASKFMAMYKSHKQVNIKLVNDVYDLNNKLTQTIQQNFELQEQVEHTKNIITNLRKAERKHVSTIKKLTGK